jgi:hypothetical protein
MTPLSISFIIPTIQAHDTAGARAGAANTTLPSLSRISAMP